MIILFVDNLFFYLGGQSVSCKASLAALRLYGYTFVTFLWCYLRYCWPKRTQSPLKWNSFTKH